MEWGYLLMLLVVTLGFYFLVFKDTPEFTNLQSQFIATFTSVIPLIAIFSIMEGSKDFTSWGKRKARLKIMALSIVYILMAFIRKDNRHLADILAGSTVIKNRK
jgi:hypothetical protein